MEFLSAPDQASAAAVIAKNDVFFGRGDFQKILEFLAATRSEEYKDLGSKLKMLKKGFFNDDLLFSDKARHIQKDHGVNYKLVFRIWARQVHENDPSD